MKKTTTNVVIDTAKVACLQHSSVRYRPMPYDFVLSGLTSLLFSLFLKQTVPNYHSSGDPGARKDCPLVSPFHFLTSAVLTFPKAYPTRNLD